ncbi:conserved oligomeric Golgi complex subunit 8-like [Paramacrobiotus metropolitanus]|uniref:conserved oligomeric Golgi complex subunit 8-like n=1 Tax=Paramacrobiotus metropolitanus TaxID=2943436 RepID=UPI0024464643|nr:conserved oligomeric Golgi complex subunit 8-like [Paramacrobiotus metropolitanus]
MDAMGEFSVMPLNPSVTIEDSFDPLEFFRNLLVSDGVLPAETQNDDARLQLTAQYVSELLQSNLEILHAEEARLHEATAKLHEEKTALVVENYTVLLTAASQINDVVQELPNIQNRVKERLQNCKQAETLCQALEKRAADYHEQIAQSRNQFMQLHQIQDLLDIPNSITNLAKNGLFDEAVDLILFVDKLNHQAVQAPIVAHLVEETRKRAWMLMNLLSNKFRTSPVQLLEALKTVSLQRRLGSSLGVSVEEFVRTDFLQARSVYIGSLVRAVPQKETFQTLSKILEICRLHYFETVNLYLSVFPDNPELLPDLRILPYVWLNKEVSELSKLFAKSLPRVDNSHLESLFNQYLSLMEMFSRFGANSSAECIRVFIDYLFSQLKTAFRDAVDNFTSSVRTKIQKKPWSQPKYPSDVSDRQNAVKPPVELMEYPQLAVLGNSILDALNRLRFCFVSSLVVPVIHSINTLLFDVGVVIRGLERKEGQLVEDLENAYHKFFVPFIEKARDMICPLQEATAVLGVSLHEAKLLLAVKPVQEDGFTNSRVDGENVLVQNGS